MRLRGGSPDAPLWHRPGWWLAIAAAVIVAIAGAGYAYARTGKPVAAASTTAKVQHGAVTLTSSAAGTVQPVNSRGLAFSTSGVVTEIDVKAGDQVAPGQVLARIDGTDASTAVDTAQTNVASAQDALTRAQQTATATPTPTPPPAGAASCPAAAAGVRVAAAMYEGNGHSWPPNPTSTPPSPPPTTSPSPSPTPTPTPTPTLVPNPTSTSPGGHGGPGGTTTAPGGAGSGGAGSGGAGSGGAGSGGAGSGGAGSGGAGSGGAGAGGARGCPGSSTGAGGGTNGGGAGAGGAGGGANAGGASGGRASTSDSLLQAQQQLTNAQLTLQQAQDKLAGTVITAPVAGLVLSISGAVGAQETPGGSGFIVLGGVNDSAVRAQFSEADVAHLAIGQAATITLPNQAGLQAKGKLSQIDPAGTVSGRLVRYGVTVVFDQVPESLLLGQTANVSVVTDSATDVLFVLSAAVRNVQNGSGTVVVRSGGQDRRRTVGVGLRGDQYTVLTSGASQGDDLVISSDTTA